jgi:excinuclease ABC subunit A
VLDLTAEEAAALFEPVRRIHEPLALLCDVGLGYLQIGQPSQTLSGGEAQRVKLVEELARRSNGRTVYVLDEPSVGLHLDDLGKLIDVLHRLVDRGDTVIVIEHDLDVIASADWIVDMGPAGGAGGGKVVYQGPRDGLARCVGSRTAPYLRAHLEGAPHVPLPLPHKLSE